jgi:hypothetical protein
MTPWVRNEHIIPGRDEETTVSVPDLDVIQVPRGLFERILAEAGYLPRVEAAS